MANVERIERVRAERRAPQPIVACRLTRCAATIEEFEAFFDDWIRRCGSAVIRGYNDFCGALPPDTLLSTTPRVRQPCRRLTARLMLLGDGSVALCGQDYPGKTRLGDWTKRPLQEIWSGLPLIRAREAHARLQLESLPICSQCTEWSRP